MAIGFGRAAGNAASGSPASPLVVTVTINAGETAILHFVSVGGSGGVTSISGGGTWTKRTGNIFTGTSRINSEIWTTDVGAAAGAASISISYNGAPTAVAGEVGAYTGVLGLGVVATPVGQSTSNPTISLTTQDANNWIVGAFGSNDFSEAPATYTASGAGVTNRGDAGVSAATDAHTAILDNTRATPGSVTVSITYAGADYSVVAIELRSVSASTPKPLLGSLTLKSATGAPIMAVKIGNYIVPSVAVSANISLTADIGSLLLTGFAPVLDQGITASLGQLVLNGFAPSLDQKLNAALGQLTLTGFAPSLDQKVNAALGALTLTGFAPSLDQKINAALGQLVLTGFAPSLDNKINAAVGQLVLNGFAASPVVGTNLIAQLGALDLTGFAPTVDVTNNISILAGLGQLLIDGFAPDITGQDTTQVAGTGPTGDRRMALMEELRELQQTLAQEKEPQHKGFRDDRVVKRRKEIEAALRLEQKREAARLAAEVAAENEDEEGLLNIILNFLGGSDVS